ncbi:MAG TPA: glutamate-5-semialdehyde dehydrogenase [Thermoflexales bacterium]|nr:glutamate-5-semialdehyde dehydrogenase [Thermoflexales bacterium]
MTTSLHALGAQTRAAGKLLARAGTAPKNAVLLSLADGIEASQGAILQANAGDVRLAAAAGKTEAYIDRLTLNPKRLKDIANDVRSVAALPDPIGEQFDHTTLPNGLRLHKRRVPLGVLGVIYESRPNVTTDISALAIKSGNACMLRGGSDTLATNRALLACAHAALQAHGLPAEAVAFIDDPDRARILELLKLNDFVDLIIPRGGAQLHQMCRDNSTIPVITGGMGINHIFVDETANQQKSIEVIHNAKTQKPSACNSLGTLLVHRAIAAQFLPAVAARLADVTLHCDDRALELLRGAANAVPAQMGDWDVEWLALIAGVKVVDSLDEALAFIQAHSLGHSDAILSESAENIARFLNVVDSSAVFVNASPRFNDGSQFGLGAEVAISTQRVHARGPMGLRELTIYKWVGEGSYAVRG